MELINEIPNLDLSASFNLKDRDNMTSFSNYKKQVPKKFYIFRIVLVASVGGFLFGYDGSVITGALPFLTEYFHLSATGQGVAVSSAALGAIVGPLGSLKFAERIGRRKTMIVAVICFSVSAIGNALSITIWDFAFWRFVTGIGVGLAMISSPIYIAELSPPKIRGQMVNMNQLSNVLGILLAVIASYFFSFSGWGWRWMFGSEVIPSVLLAVGLIFIPESPIWLSVHGRFKEALYILTKINGVSQAQNELHAIKTEIVKERDTSAELLQPGFKRALIVAIILMIFSQINGVNMMLTYAPTILADAGIKMGTNAILSSIPIFLFIFVCTIIAFYLIKHFSRRGLLITSVLFMAVGHVIMAINLQEHWPPLYTLIPMSIGAGAFTLGLAPLSWVIVSEIFPNSARGKGLAIVCFFLYLSSFITSLAFPILTHWFNSRFNNTSGVYWIFFCICIGCLIFSYKMIPETKGFTLDQIGEFWRAHSSGIRKNREGIPLVKRF
ncbi:MAG: MFS transporter [Chitinophagaceae bacterium]|nr:MAG: MFS transporter [Chitinophagaceae bacterium]